MSKVKDDSKNEDRRDLEVDPNEKCEDPPQWCCPITHDLMVDPVQIEGEDPRHIYERSAIEDWIKAYGGVYYGPKSRGIIHNPILISCTQLKAEIQKYRDMKVTIQAKIDEMDDGYGGEDFDIETLSEMEQRIQKLREIGEAELADAYAVRLSFIRQAVPGIRKNSLGHDILAQIGSAVSDTTTAVAAGVGVILRNGSSAAQLARDTLIEQFETQKQQTNAANNAHFDGMIKRLNDGEDPATVKAHREEVTATAEPIEANLRQWEKRLIKCVEAGVGVFASTVGVCWGLKLSCVVKATPLLAVGTHPVTTAIAIVALLSLCIYRVGKRYHRWEKIQKKWKREQQQTV